MFTMRFDRVPTALRRSLLERVFVHLTAGVVLAQIVICHWAMFLTRGEAPGLGELAVVAVVIGVGNALVVPLVVGSRAKGGVPALLARGFGGMAVTALLLASAVVASWVLFALLSGLLGFAGIDSLAPFGVFRALSLGLVGGTALVTAWGFTWGQARVERTRVRIEIPRLDASLAGLRLVHITDLHIGNALGGAKLDRMIDRVNTTDPDLIVVTGDLFDFDPSCLDDGALSLARLRARYGVFAVLGNHDGYVGSDRVAAALARNAAGIRVLRDEIARVPVDAPLYLAGIEDPGHCWFDRKQQMSALDAVARQRPTDGPVLLLAHQPENFQHAAQLGFPLVLAGHTHGGQIALPGLEPYFNAARLVTRYTRGLFHANGSAMYVNRGLGVGGPSLRIAAPREIATIELASAGEAGARSEA